MSFVVVQRAPRQPADACRSVQLLGDMLSLYHSTPTPDLIAFMETISEEFAAGCCIWPVSAHQSASSVSNRLAFEWLASYLKKNSDCQEIIFMCNSSAGFYSYAAMCFEQFYDLKSQQCKKDPNLQCQWLVCWRKDEIFGHADQVALRTTIALFVSKSLQIQTEVEETTIHHTDQPDVSVFRTALNACDDIIVLCSSDGSVIEVNRTATMCFGDLLLTQKRKTISWLASVIHPDDLFSITNSWRARQKEGYQELEVENCRMIHENGRSIVHTVRIVPVVVDIDSAEPVQNWVFFARDSEKIEREKRAQMIEDSRTRFLAEMSHEIRTPLSCIIGTTDLLKYTNLQREQQELTSTISTCSRQLFQLIENVLDFSKIQEKRLLINPVKVVLEKVINEAVQFVAPEIHRKDLDFFLNIAPDVPECIKIDELRLRQILTNLIGNAVKFTADQTMVSVSVRKEPAETIIEPNPHCPNDTIKLRFEIDDRGPGLAEGDYSTLFESYVQLNETIQSKFGGTGLGLAISKRLVTMMGGSVWFESSSSQGCKFIFTILTCPVDSDQCPDDDSLTLTKASKTLNEYLMSFILKKHHVSIAIYARSKDLKHYLNTIYSHFEELDVVDIVQNGNNTKFIIVTDDSMALDSLKDLITKNVMGVIILTRDEVRMIKKLYEKGISAKTVRRPIYAPLLIKTTFELLVEAQMADTIGSSNYSVIRKVASDSKTSGQSHYRVAQSFPMNILIVDDNSINIQLMNRILKRCGYENLLTAADGKEAIERFSTEVGPIHCIFMDMEMPEMNGCDSTEHIRKAATRLDKLSPHIIALTANAFPEDRVKCMESGMCRYMSKPIRWEQLEQELEFAFKAINNQSSCRCNEERILQSI